MDSLEKLYTAYGEAMVKQEILANHIRDIKRQINEMLKVEQKLPPQGDSSDSSGSETN